MSFPPPSTHCLIASLPLLISFSLLYIIPILVFTIMHLLIFYHNEHIYKSADARAHGSKRGEPASNSIAPCGKAVVPIKGARGGDATVAFSAVGGVSTKMKDEICWRCG